MLPQLCLIACNHILEVFKGVKGKSGDWAGHDMVLILWSSMTWLCGIEHRLAGKTQFSELDNVVRAEENKIFPTFYMT